MPRGGNALYTPAPGASLLITLLLSQTSASPTVDDDSFPIAQALLNIDDQTDVETDESVVFIVDSSTAGADIQHNTIYESVMDKGSTCLLRWVEIVAPHKTVWTQAIFWRFGGEARHIRRGRPIQVKLRIEEYVRPRRDSVDPIQRPRGMPGILEMECVIAVLMTLLVF